jgi:hypothetical protein
MTWSKFYIHGGHTSIRRDENCAVLAFYAACSGNFLPTFRDMSFPSSRWTAISSVITHTSAVLITSRRKPEKNAFLGDAVQNSVVWDLCLLVNLHTEINCTCWFVSGRETLSKRRVRSVDWGCRDCSDIWGVNGHKCAVATVHQLLFCRSGALSKTTPHTRSGLAFSRRSSRNPLSCRQPAVGLPERQDQRDQDSWKSVCAFNKVGF